MPLDAAPDKEKNQTVFGARGDNSVDLKRPRLGKTHARNSNIALTCGNTSSRKDKSSCDRCDKMLRKLHPHTTRDILQMKTRRCPHKVAQILACQALGKKINLSLDLESSTG